MAFNWFPGTVIATQSFDPGPDLPAGPPTGTDWENQGFRWFHKVFPFCYKDITGKITCVSQSEFADKFALAVWSALKIDQLIAKDTTDWLGNDDSVVLAIALGAEGVTSWDAQPPSTVIPQNYLVFDKDGDIRLLSAGMVLNVLRRNGPVLGLQIVLANLMGGRTNEWRPTFAQVDNFVNQSLMAPTATVAPAPAA